MRFIISVPEEKKEYVRETCLTLEKGIEKTAWDYAVKWAA